MREERWNGHSHAAVAPSGTLMKFLMGIPGRVRASNEWDTVVNWEGMMITVSIECDNLEWLRYRNRNSHDGTERGEFSIE